MGSMGSADGPTHDPDGPTHDPDRPRHDPDGAHDPSHVPDGARLDDLPSVDGLRSRTVRLPAALAEVVGARPSALVDADEHVFMTFGRRGLLCGLGVAAVLPVRGTELVRPTGGIARWLATIPGVDPLRRPGSGPLAVGALPFAPDEPGWLVVPALSIVRSASGDAWATLVGTTGPSQSSAAGSSDLGTDDAVVAAVAARLAGVASRDAATSAAPRAPRALVLHPSADTFRRAIEQALRAIADGQLTKVVLARRVDVDLDGPPDLSAIVRRLAAAEPHATVFVHRSPARAFVGASPELLVRRRGTRVVSHPLAGTATLANGWAAAVERLGAAKERAEHRVVVDEVAARLAPWCTSIQVPDQPTPVRLSTIVHLGTRITGRLKAVVAAGSTPGPPDAWTLAADLHPTPAVAGVPRTAALELIAALEPAGRGPYAGPVGWVDARGDGDVLVAIRSATIAGDRASAHAGVGIVTGSDPRRELAETSAKLHTALTAVGVGAHPLLSTDDPTDDPSPHSAPPRAPAPAPTPPSPP